MPTPLGRAPLVAGPARRNSVPIGASNLVGWPEFSGAEARTPGTDRSSLDDGSSFDCSYRYANTCSRDDSAGGRYATTYRPERQRKSLAAGSFRRPSASRTVYFPDCSGLCVPSVATSPPGSSQRSQALAPPRAWKRRAQNRARLSCLRHPAAAEQAAQLVTGLGR